MTAGAHPRRAPHVAVAASERTAKRHEAPPTLGGISRCSDSPVSRAAVADAGQTVGTASCDQTVPSSAGAGQARSRLEGLATTQTPAEAGPTPTAHLPANPPPPLGAGHHTARLPSEGSGAVPE